MKKISVIFLRKKVEKKLLQKVKIIKEPESFNSFPAK